VQRQAAWPSGPGKGLQSPLQRFDSARRLRYFFPVETGRRVWTRSACWSRPSPRPALAGWLTYLVAPPFQGPLASSNALSDVNRALSRRALWLSACFLLDPDQKHTETGKSHEKGVCWRPHQQGGDSGPAGLSGRGKHRPSRRAQWLSACVLLDLDRSGLRPRSCEEPSIGA
jgi:hypothetical protein